MPQILSGTLLTVLSVGLYILSFPKFSLWLILIALLPFLIALKHSSCWTSIFYGVLFGILYTCGMGYWLIYALRHHYGQSWVTSLLFIFVCVVLPYGFLSALFAVTYRFFYHSGIWFHGLVVPSLWIIVDYLKECLPFMIPWASIGYGLLPWETLVQIADIGGLYGLSFLVVLINSMLVYLMEQKSKTGLLIILMALGVPFIYGTIRVQQIPKQIELKSDFNAVLVQGNFSLKDRWSGMGFYHRIKTYLDLSQCLPDNEHKDCIIVWPETVLNSLAKLDPLFFKNLQQALKPNHFLIAGGLRQQLKEVYNCAYLLSKTELKWYDKHILLPYAENTPRGIGLGSFYEAPEKFSPGFSPATVDLIGIRMSLSICLEMLYGNYIRQSILKGGQILVNISNDAWFGKTSMPVIHLNASRLRAVENRRFVLRSSNSGISAIISPLGRIVKQSQLFTREKISGTVVLLDHKSFYTRWGDWIIFLALAVLLIKIISKKIKNGNLKPSTDRGVINA